MFCIFSFSTIQLKRALLISFFSLLLTQLNGQRSIFSDYLKINDSLQYFDTERLTNEIKKFETNFKTDSSLAFYSKILFGDFVSKKSNSHEALRAFIGAISLAKNQAEKLFLGYYKSGKFYLDNDDLSSATKYFNKALLNRSDTCHTNLDFKIYYEQGLINSYLDNNKTSILYYNKALKVAEKNHNTKQKAAMLNNLGLIYLEINDSILTKYYLYKSLEIRLEGNDSVYIGQSYNNIGMYFYKYEKYKEALTHFKRGYRMRKNNNAQVSALVESQINIGKSLFKLKQLNESVQIFNEAIIESKKIDNIELERRALEPLIEISEQSKQFEKAYNYQKRYFFIKDSLYGLDKIQELRSLTFQYDFSKKLQQDSLKYEKKDIERKKEIELKEEKNKLLNYVLIIIAIALCICGYFIYKLKKSNAERKSANALITKQKDEIFQKQKEVLDSINYAKRIQLAMLPSDKFIARILKQFQ